ncbi:MAG: cation diffusion facilitator family transporter [Bacteroidales bacterium]|nr:cation diffusion facilitator family transporter [Bacteroidales bacterium]
MNLQKKKVGVARLSVISNLILVLFKLVIGLIIGSVAVISEAIHSAIDFLASVIALFAVKESNKPPDVKHPFGHGKFENISGAIEAFLIFVAAGWIISESIDKLMNPSEIENIQLGIYIMLISSLVNIFVSRRLFKIGKESDSIALKADAWHLLTDVYTSLGVGVGLGIIALIGYFLPGLNVTWLDPVIAITVALFIVKAAYDLTVQSVSGLLDSSLPKEEVEKAIEIINSIRPEIYSFHNFKTRKAGAERFVEFHLIVDSKMTVQNSHDICDEITKRIKEELSNTVVMIHTEPCDNSCKKKCLDNCEVKKKE